MTLVLSFACRGIVVQVADRLVSQLRGRALTPLDPIANKLLIYRARDAMVSIGYAGQAFIGRVPTDEWIARLLSGVALERNGTSGGGVRVGRTPHNWDIGKALRRIRDDLAPLIAKGPVVQLCAAGHQFDRRGRVRLLVCEMTLRRDEIVSFWQMPRNVGSGVGCLNALGFELGGAERQQILNHIRDARPPLSGDQIAQFLTATIRKHERPGVGPHTSTVILPFPGAGPVRSRFFPLTPHHALMQTKDEERCLEVDYAPWVIGPGIVKPPTVEVGDMHINLTGPEVILEGSVPQAGGPLAMMKTVPRFSLPGSFRS